MNLKSKAIFITLIVFMIGVIVLGIVAENQMLDAVSKNKKYVDKYVSNIDETFVYKGEETVDDNVKLFYYTSQKYPSFTLIVTADTTEKTYRLTDNFASLNMYTEIQEYFENYFGENSLVKISNVANLNILSTVEESISYNVFNMMVGIVQNENTDADVEQYKDKLVADKIDCNIYFYYLTQEQFDKYKDEFSVTDNGFLNYQMYIIENGQITTEIKYE